MSAQPLYNVPKGSILKLDGRELTVSVCEESGYAVQCLDSGECFTLAIDRVDDAIRSRDCEVIKPADAEKRRILLEYTGGIERVEQFPEETQRIVQGRLALVLAQDELREEGEKLTQRTMDKGGKHRRLLLERADGIAPGFNFRRARRGGKLAAGFDVPQGRTLACYRDVYHRFDRNPVVLADRDHKKGRREPRLCDWQERFISYVVDLWLKPQKPKLAELYAQAKKVFHRSPQELAQCISFPTITTIRSRIKAISEVVRVIGRGGKRHATNVKGPRSTDVRAMAFG